MTETSKENNMALRRVLYIYYLVQFKKKEIQALIDIGSEVNAMTSAYTSTLGLQARHINVRGQKIDWLYSPDVWNGSS